MLEFKSLHQGRLTQQKQIRSHWDYHISHPQLVRDSRVVGTTTESNLIKCFVSLILLLAIFFSRNRRDSIANKFGATTKCYAQEGLSFQMLYATKYPVGGLVEQARV